MEEVQGDTSDPFKKNVHGQKHLREVNSIPYKFLDETTRQKGSQNQAPLPTISLYQLLCYPGSLVFSKRRDVLPQDLVKSRSREIRV